MADVNEYRRMLTDAWDRLEQLDDQPPDAVDEDTYREAAEVVESVRRDGLKLGFGDEIPPPAEAMRPHDAMSVVGRLMERCRERRAASGRSKRNKAGDEADAPPPAVPDILTIPQAAEYTSRGENTIRDLCNSGELKCSRAGKGDRGPFRIRREELDRWLRESEKAQQDKATPRYRNLPSP